jgi:hypothetical protein
MYVGSVVVAGLHLMVMAGKAVCHPIAVLVAVDKVELAARV